MKKEELITYPLLLWLFEYKKNEGLLVWKNHHVKNKSWLLNTIAGTKTAKGYLQTRINGKNYLIHRLIYFIETKTWPKILDHIDGNKLNNNFTNLRSTTNRENLQNKKRHRNGSLPGCWFDKTRNVWRSEIQVNGKKIYLGSFSNETEANNKYSEYRKTL